MYKKISFVILLIAVIGVGILIRPQADTVLYEHSYEDVNYLLAEEDQSIGNLKTLVEYEAKGYAREDLLALMTLSEDFEDQLITLNETAYALKFGETSYILKDLDAIEDVLTSLYRQTASQYDAEVTVAVTDQLEILTSIEQHGDTKLLEVGFLEPVSIKSLSVAPGKIQDKHAVFNDVILDDCIKEEYVVQPGDAPSTIAENFDLGLAELYALNPGLELKTSTLKAGETIIIEEEQSLGKTFAVIESTDEEIIPKEYVYVDDPTQYKGSESTISYGSNGVKTVLKRKIVVDNQTVSAEVLDVVVVQTPEEAVISRGTRALPAKGTLGTFVYPVEAYRVSSKFGLRWNREHRGIDLSVPTGTTVMASDGGVVTRAQWSDSYGYYIEITHSNNVKTRYAHNSSLLVSVGDEVSQYQVIAKSGSTGNSTGPHVHFEIIIDGVWVNPLNYLE